MIDLATERRTAPITARQREVVALIAAGYSNDEVGVHLGDFAKNGKGALRRPPSEARRASAATDPDRVPAPDRRGPAIDGALSSHLDYRTDRVRRGGVLRERRAGGGAMSMTSVSPGPRRCFPAVASASGGVVERPRLFAILDHSKARVERSSRPAATGRRRWRSSGSLATDAVAAWFTARSSVDGRRGARLSVWRGPRRTSSKDATSVCGSTFALLPAPAENVETLAEILGEDLAAWPDSAWLVVDDYHEIAVRARGRGLRRGPRRRVDDPVPGRGSTAPVVGLDQEPSLRRRARGESGRARDGRAGSGCSSCRPNRLGGVGPRRPRERLARRDRPRRRVLGGSSRNGRRSGARVAVPLLRGRSLLGAQR